MVYPITYQALKRSPYMDSDSTNSAYAKAYACHYTPTRPASLYPALSLWPLNMTTEKHSIKRVDDEYHSVERLNHDKRPQLQRHQSLDDRKTTTSVTAA